MNKKFLIFACLIGVTITLSACSNTPKKISNDPGNIPDTEVYDKLYTNNNIGACAFTDKSTFEITEKAYISKIRMWYYWKKNETQLPFTLKKDGKEIISGVLMREDCDPHQTSWCEANYYPKSNFEAGTYILKVKNANLCQNIDSDGNGMYLLLGKKIEKE